MSRSWGLLGRASNRICSAEYVAGKNCDEASLSSLSALLLLAGLRAERRADSNSNREAVAVARRVRTGAQKAVHRRQSEPRLTERSRPARGGADDGWAGVCTRRRDEP